jgi:hypothetical protein
MPLTEKNRRRLDNAGLSNAKNENRSGWRGQKREKNSRKKWKSSESAGRTRRGRNRKRKQRKGETETTETERQCPHLIFRAGNNHHPIAHSLADPLLMGQEETGGTRETPHVVMTHPSNQSERENASLLHAHDHDLPRRVPGGGSIPDLGLHPQTLVADEGVPSPDRLLVRPHSARGKKYTLGILPETDATVDIATALREGRLRP